ncbi:asparagine synthase-related protein [Paenibacillus eucommiae]|uniref:asparagine synthase (glutamine-hydrolyzing) n=1 Tax=Paenibacillus eucommiae TaxID=1355755 RepID=A0ABS4IVS0_9BACL|nr:asparagine synthase-related protein [Paenibacillus eucommiae]MBP1991692.1 asparagine synthase (glutamine-hydrolyzing) [Paenibacillus eucommiae]
MLSLIAGILDLNDEYSSGETIVHMMKALRKYPADEVNIWRGNCLSMGCHAQWVTPESINEVLPRYDVNRELVITADAIIDNRKQLCDQLEIEYSTRKTITDSELILAAYMKWGKSTPKYLIGDYAFIIWDKRRQQLFGARDLLGRRTLYYHHVSTRFAFCTVINPLFVVPGIHKKLNESWFAEFLAIPMMLDTIDVHSTVYEDIKQLPPAHSFTVAEGVVTIEQYDELAASSHKLKLQTNGDYVDAFREVFQEAVQSKLRTYRQVGVRLSGGLDSGAVASFAAKPLLQEGKVLHAFSYIPSANFEDWTPKSLIANETPYIQESARYIGNIKENYLAFEGRNAISEMDTMLELMEGPYKFFENSFWLTGMLEKSQEQNVGVLLNGSRGNYTISWGDPIDYYARLFRTLRWTNVFQELNDYTRLMRTGKSVVIPIIAKQAYAYLFRSALAKKKSNIPLVIHPDFAARTKVIDKLMHHPVGLTAYAPDEVTARNNQFQRFSASNHIGTSTTKLSLPYAVSERDPTSDPRIIRFCLSLPHNQYIQHGIDRSLIRRSMEGYLPDMVRMNIHARGVQGADWIYRMLPDWGEFRDQLHKLCRDSNASYYLNVPQIKQSLEKLGTEPKLEYAFDLDARLLMRSLIAYRFIKQLS